MLKPILLTLVVLATLLLAPLLNQFLLATPVQAEASSPRTYPYPIDTLDHSIFLPYICIAGPCSETSAYPLPYPYP
jgi:hypothetical protein